MLADRPYRAALTTSAARDVLIGGRGTQFDPEVADTLVRLLDEHQLQAA